MKRRITILLTIAALLRIGHASAQLSITGEVTARTEFRHGFKKLAAANQDAALFTEQRSRLYFDYKSDKILTKITLQDIRTWGAVSQIFKTDPSLSNLNEAWGGYKFTPKSTVKIGRMELNYDNARVLGNLGWAMQSRSHDLIKYEMKDSLSTFHLGFAFNQDANTPEFRKLASTFYGTSGNYKTMQYAWYNKTIDKGSFSLLGMNTGFQVAADSSMYFIQTLGGMFKKKATDKLSVMLEGYYQLGKDAADRDVGAYDVTLDLGYKASKKVGITLGTEYMSGSTLDDAATKNGSFNPFFGTNHKFNGFMDYFYVGNGHANTAAGGSNAIGLIDIYLKGKIKTGDKSLFLAHLHNFSSPVEVQNASLEKQSGGLGTEIDLVYVNKLTPGITLKMGYSQMFATTTMEVIKGGSKDELNNWAWAMLVIKPKFL